MNNNYLNSIIKLFEYYKMLGEKTFDQLSDEQLFYKVNDESNSIAVIVKHLWGNMMSRWTDFLTSDGEKNWRDRDAEFLLDIKSREEMLQKWDEGWNCLFTSLNELHEENLGQIIYIRNMGHTVTEAIFRQLAHYSYHIGQIVLIGKMQCNHNWSSLSIPKGNSKVYNESKFAAPKEEKHFTDEFLSKNKT